MKADKMNSDSYRGVTTGVNTPRHGLLNRLQLLERKFAHLDGVLPEIASLNARFEDQKVEGIYLSQLSDGYLAFRRRFVDLYHEGT